MEKPLLSQNTNLELMICYNSFCAAWLMWGFFSPHTSSDNDLEWALCPDLNEYECKKKQKHNLGRLTCFLKHSHRYFIFHITDLLAKQAIPTSLYRNPVTCYIKELHWNSLHTVTVCLIHNDLKYLDVE